MGRTRGWQAGGVKAGRAGSLQKVNRGALRLCRGCEVGQEVGMLILARDADPRGRRFDPHLAPLWLRRTAPGCKSFSSYTRGVGLQPKNKLGEQRGKDGEADCLSECMT